MAGKSRGDTALFVLGVLLLGGYVTAATQVELPWLVALQADDQYRVSSGIVLGTYLVFQMLLGARRVVDPGGAIARHKIAGALAPVVLYAHASHFAYGYLLVLAAAYLGTSGLGLAHRLVLRVRARWLYTSWFVLHVATSVALVFLVVYHAYVALAYE